MSDLTNPQKIYNLGDRSVRKLFDVPVQVQEKIDGSFFSFGVTLDKGLVIRSKNHEIKGDGGMFQLAIERVKSIQHLLTVGWVYRAEAVTKPRHNVLNYERIPAGGLILFDVLTGHEEYLQYPDLVAEAIHLQLEVVRQFFAGKVNSVDELTKYLDEKSALGKVNIEGVVIKPLEPIYDQENKLLYGKLVSQQFKEVMKAGVSTRKVLTVDDLGDHITEMYATPARFQKAVQSLKEEGKLTESSRDIGNVIKSAIQDIEDEGTADIKDRLFEASWPIIRKQLARAASMWYSERLLQPEVPTEPVNPTEDEASIVAFNTESPAV